MGLNEFEKKDILQSAVIVLYEQVSDSLILTQRSEHLRAHPGEICFPGGRWEVGDKNFYATAQREVYEELGITANRITLIKELAIEKTISGVEIYPWFATITSVHPYSLNTEEVVRLIAVPMSLVQDAQNYRDFSIEYENHLLKSCEFIFNENRIWGATARIMRQLVQ